MKKYLYIILCIACVTAACSKNEDKKNAQVKTLGATGVTNVEAACWGKITEQGTAGISEYGIEVIFPEGAKMLKYTTSKADSFAVQLNGLIEGNQYVYRAYAVENGSAVTRYGGYESFTTLVPAEFYISFTNIADREADVEFIGADLLRS
ncbi:MAG: hypothetical protein LBK58_04210, partial [Prevotellaceae bacterium]|nr:hypothetical protein [Prevotellaceae bacterium]